MISPSKSTTLKACCVHPELTVDSAKMQGRCKLCNATFHGCALVDFLLKSIEIQNKELMEARKLAEKYERVILSEALNSVDK